MISSEARIVVLTVVFACALPAVSAATQQERDSQLPGSAVMEMISRIRASSTKLPPDAAAMAQQLLVAQRYPEAREIFAALLEKRPKDSGVLYGLALAELNVGEQISGEGHAQNAVELLSATTRRISIAPVQKADALVLLAVIQGAEGKDTLALETVQSAVRLAPSSFDAQFTLGRALYGAGDLLAAAKAFRIAHQIKPADAKSLFFLATALEGAGETNAALQAYRELIKLQPNTPDGHLGLGVLLLKSNPNDDVGIAELRTAVRLEPQQYEAQVALGRALLARQQMQESVEHFQRAAEIAPNNPEPHYQLAIAYRRLGATEKAAEESAIVKRIHEERRGEPRQEKPDQP